MEWLTGWLKSIILVILLATVVDLLLPNTTMQRYVKTVMSLIILLTLLTPIFDVFQKKWDVGKLLAAATQKQVAYEQRMDMKSMQAITSEAQQLMQNVDKQSKQVVETRIAAMVKEKVEENTDRPVNEVRVLTGTDKAGQPTIESIDVMLGTVAPLKRTSPSGSKVEMVEPVSIALQAIKERKSVAAMSMTDAEQDKQLDLIRSKIAEQWQLKENKINILVEKK